MKIQDRGQLSDQCSWPLCHQEGMTIFAPGATSLNPFRACFCDKHLETFMTRMCRNHSEHVQKPEQQPNK